MAEPVWGTTQYSANSAYRLGIEYIQSPTTVTSSTDTVTITAKIWLWSKYYLYYSSEAKLSWSGSYGSSSKVTSFSIGAESGAWSTNNRVVLHTLTRKVTASPSSAINTSLTARLGISVLGKDATVSASWTTAKKPTPSVPPNSPLDVVGKYSSEDIVVTWTNRSTSANPWTSVRVEKWDAENNVWTRMYSGPGSMWTYTDKSIWPGNRYAYRIVSINSAGETTSGASAPIYTTPFPPRNVVASKSNSNILLKWDKPEPYPAVSYSPQYKIVWRENPGSWQYSSAVFTSALQYTFTPPNPSSTYQFAIQTYGENTTTSSKASDYVWSNNINVSLPPLAPELISPLSGVTSGSSIKFSWKHNPQDGSAQESAEVRWREVGSTTWTTQSVTGATSTLTISSLPSEKKYEWEVRTKGENPILSPWGSATFGVSQKPSVTINTTPDVYWGKSNLMKVRWTYTDPAGDTSSKYSVLVTDKNTGEAVKTISESSSTQNSGTTNATSTFNVIDGHTYESKVQMADSWGVWSDWDTKSVVVDYDEPATPTISSEFLPEDGVVDVTVESLERTSPNPVSIELYKYIKDGEWERVYVGSPSGFTWRDWTPSYGIGNHNLYVARSVSSYPSYSISPISVAYANPPGCSKWLWLSSDLDPTKRVRLRGNPSVGSTKERSKTLRRFYGDTYPTEFSSPEITHQISVAGSLDRDSSTWVDWENMVDLDGTFWYRDPWGRNVQVSLGKVSVDSNIPGYESISTELTVVNPSRGVLNDTISRYDALTEIGVNLYQISQGEGISLSESGNNLYTFRVDPGERLSLVPSPSGSGLYKIIYWDSPEVIYD